MYTATSGTLQEGVTAISNIMADPALPRIQYLIGELNRVDPEPSGIGLKDIVKPLQAYVYTKRNPWVVPVVVVALLGIPLLAGYLTARSR